MNNEAENVIVFSNKYFKLQRLKMQKKEYEPTTLSLFKIPDSKEKIVLKELNQYIKQHNIKDFGLTATPQSTFYITKEFVKNIKKVKIFKITNKIFIMFSMLINGLFVFAIKTIAETPYYQRQWKFLKCSYYLDCMTSILMIVVNLGISVYFILNISKSLAGITFITIPMLYFINFIFQKKVYMMNQKIRIFTDKYYSFLNESLSEVIQIKAFGLENIVSQRYKEYLKERLRILLKKEVLLQKIGFIRGGSGNIINVIILFVAGMSIVAGNMTIGMLVSFCSYMEKFFEALSKIMELNLNKQEVVVSYERMNEILNSEKEENNGIILKEPIQKIQFRQVIFGYKDNLVLKKIDLSIENPGLYSLVGSNGCGKSTIFKLLERFYECKVGKIEINQVPINKYSASDLRNNIVYMPKKPFFLQGTIMDNLKLGQNEISDLEVIEVCKKVGIHSDIQKLDE